MVFVSVFFIPLHVYYDDSAQMKSLRIKAFRTLWTAGAAVLFFIFMFFLLIFNGVLGYMPDFEQLQNPVNKYASQVYSSDGKLMGTWSYSNANRIFIDYNQLSPWLVKALVATEDERFYEHSGIDVRALGRAIIKRGVLRQKSAGGGSTITQQLAKQLYSEQAQSSIQRLLQKPVEWVIALKLERYYTKEEIITLYLNYFDFLHNAVGIKTAAKTYFNKTPDALTVGEAATLIGMCKNPAYYNPVRFLERTEQRRNTVLGQMVKNGYLTDVEYDQYSSEPLELNYTRQDHKDGKATYLREFLRQTLMAKKPVRSDYASWQNQKFYEDSLAWENDPMYGWCNKNHKRDGSTYNLYTDGLKIYTTIDSRMQEYAEKSVYEHVSKVLQPVFDKQHKNNPKAPYSTETPASLRQKLIEKAMRQTERWIMMKKNGYSDDQIINSFHQPVEMTLYTHDGDVERTMTPYDSLLYYKQFLHSSFLCMDNHTGEVKAYVGGLDYTHFAYDMATQGRRQVGSTIKPFLYSLAMENGYTPCDEVPDVATSYGGWTPRGGGSGGMVTLRYALQTSNNTVSAYLINQLSPTQFVSMLRQFGIKNRNFDTNLTLCLGSCDISLVEMVSAYTAFPNRGVRMCPVYITRIEDAEGNVVASLANGLAPQSHEVITEASSYRMISIMRGVMDGGTGGRMRYKYGIHSPMGGKTGTTNGNSDGWFIGYTPRYTFGAWVGGEERDIHFDSMAYGQGAAAALPICALFMQKVYADRSLGVSADEDFTIPSDFSMCDNGLGSNWFGGDEEEEATEIDELIDF